MAFADLGNPRIATDPSRTRRRRTVELLAFAATSLAFLFVLAIAFGAISA